MLRCKSMYDSKHEIVKILVQVQKLDNLLNTLEDQVDFISDEEAKATYFIILKSSFRLFNHIERMRIDNPLLNRPFIYKGANL